MKHSPKYNELKEKIETICRKATLGNGRPITSLWIDSKYEYVHTANGSIDIIVPESNMDNIESIITKAIEEEHYRNIYTNCLMRSSYSQTLDPLFIEQNIRFSAKDVKIMLPAEIGKSICSHENYVLIENVPGHLNTYRSTKLTKKYASSVFLIQPACNHCCPKA